MLEGKTNIKYISKHECIYLLFDILKNVLFLCDIRNELCFNGIKQDHQEDFCVIKKSHLCVKCKDFDCELYSGDLELISLSLRNTAAWPANLWPISIYNSGIQTI